MYPNFKKQALSLAIGLSVAASVPVYAADDATEEAEVIVVVGSRAAPRSVGDSPVPVDVISGDEFVKNGAQDMLSMLSSVVPSFNVNAQPISDAATLIRPANLRGLPPDNTLILVNGKRRHRASVIAFLGGGIADGSQGPDVSVIPSIALKQVEILRDGAAAQYGSDAIAGVINFVLKDDASGGMFEAKYGEFFEGDGTTVQYSGNMGFALSDAGFANISFELKNQDPTSRSVQRDDAIGLIAAGNIDVRQPAAQIWGTPEVNDDFKFWLNSGIDLGDGKEAYMFANWAERTVEGGFFFRNPNTRGGVFSADGGSTILTGDLTPGATNNSACPVVNIVNNVPDPAALASLEAANCFAFNSLFPGGFTPNFGGEVIDVSLTMGTKGEFDNGIAYDFSGYIGQNSAEFKIINTINASLGPNTPTEFNPGKYTQREKAFNADFVKLNNQTNVAWGVEWRQDTFIITSGDPKSYEIGPLAVQGFSSGSNGFNGFSPRSQGSFSRFNVSAYFDVESQLTDDMLVDFAIRYEDFSDFGQTMNFKLTGMYQATDELALRGSLSTGFRAPTIGQSNVINVTTAFDPSLRLVDQATLPPTNPISVQKGATPLEPEDSESLTFGMVYENDGLFVTADFFHIEVEGRIAQTSDLAVSAADIAALLAEGVDDAANFASIKFFTNDFDTTTEGLDLVVSYKTEIVEGTETKFNLAYNHTTTEVDSFNPDIISDTRVKQLEENLPEDRFTFTVAHSQGDWDSFWRINFYGEYYEAHLDAGSLPINVDSAFTVDAEIAYNFSDSLRIAVGASNLFDEFPQDNQYSGIVGAKYPVTSPYGFNGGFWYAKAQYSFN